MQNLFTSPELSERFAAAAICHVCLHKLSVRLFIAAILAENRVCPLYGILVATNREVVCNQCMAHNEKLLAQLVSPDKGPVRVHILGQKRASIKTASFFIVNNCLVSAILSPS